MFKTLFVFILAISSFTVSAQQFMNLKATKRANKIIVSYDLSTNEVGQTFNVKLECSVDGGKTFNIIPQFVSGDLKEITAGSGKRIIWDILSEQQEFSDDQFVFQLVAAENKPVVSSQEDEGIFIDSRDGHNYRWIKIGSQTWMVENLAYLPNVSPSREGSQSKPYYYVYEYNGTKIDDAKATSNYKTYGVLYNWTAAIKACPPGWHLPSDKEWKQLEIALGMTEAQANTKGSRGAESGAKMKAKDGWFKSGNGTNTSGFTVLPGGGRYGDLNFGNIGSNGYWWSATEGDSSFAWGRGLGYISSEIYNGTNYKENGYSVRCVRDF